MSFNQLEILEFLVVDRPSFIATIESNRRLIIWHRWQDCYMSVISFDISSYPASYKQNLVNLKIDIPSLTTGIISGLIQLDLLSYIKLAVNRASIRSVEPDYVKKLALAQLEINLIPPSMSLEGITYVYAYLYLHFYLLGITPTPMDNFYDHDSLTITTYQRIVKSILYQINIMSQELRHKLSCI